MTFMTLAVVFGLFGAGSPRPEFADRGVASWYGGVFHGRRTASGAVFDKREMTAAHKSLPFGTRLLVVDETTARAVVVKVTDRGPYARGRVLDLSEKAAAALGYKDKGFTRVTVFVLPAEEVEIREDNSPRS